MEIREQQKYEPPTKADEKKRLSREAINGMFDTLRGRFGNVRVMTCHEIISTGNNQI